MLAGGQAAALLQAGQQVISVPTHRTIFTPPPHTFFPPPSVPSRPGPGMEHCGHVSDSKFEELEDALEEWGDIGEIKEARDCSFGKIYNPIRALYCSDPAVLEKFEACTDHTERLKILVGMEVCIFYNNLPS